MHRDDVVRMVKEKMHELGIEPHLAQVAKVPAKVDVFVLIGNSAKRLALRSGITRSELEAKLQELASAWHLHTEGQTDIEGAAQ